MVVAVCADGTCPAWAAWGLAALAVVGSAVQQVALLHDIEAGYRRAYRRGSLDVLERRLDDPVAPIDRPT